MRERQNIADALKLNPSYMGFIFYEKSPRFVGENWKGPGADFPGTTSKVGVFVNDEHDRIVITANRYKLDYLQLHGDESPEYCRKLAEEGYSLIKAFSLREPGDLRRLDRYKPWLKYFLFDTPGSGFGGTGKTFDWSMLDNYDNDLPVFLSGGLSLDNLEQVAGLTGLNLEAIDVNSRFELEPGLKDLEKLKELKKQIHQL